MTPNLSLPVPSLIAQSSNLPFCLSKHSCNKIIHKLHSVAISYFACANIHVARSTSYGFSFKRTTSEHIINYPSTKNVSSDNKGGRDIPALGLQAFNTSYLMLHFIFNISYLTPHIHLQHPHIVWSKAI